MLISIQKSDSAATKELCIITLTKIYCMTHQYQTLIREITTPTLPTFITSCLNLLSPNLAANNSTIPSPLTEVIFWSFATLLPQHTTIYRPFVSQIRNLAKPYLAPTLSDRFVSSSLRRSAVGLTVLLHQTAAKNTGGEEWGKAVRNIVKDIHATADQVFRAVIETWESTAGYNPTDPDVSLELSGGGETADSLPSWSGVDAGIQRIVGLFGLLEEYFKQQTTLPVAIPLAIIVDLVDRVLMMVLPSPLSSSRKDRFEEAVRIRPGIDREERDGLWSGMPRIYIGALQLINALAGRLQSSFLTIAQGFLERVLWVFISGRNDPTFRQLAYQVTATSLLHVGQSLGKQGCTNLVALIQACCQDLNSLDHLDLNLSSSPSEGKNINGKRPLSHQSTDTFLHGSSGTPVQVYVERTEVVNAARDLLPLFFSHLPQKHINSSTRGLLERTVILSKNRRAMLASILSPWFGKSGRPSTSLLPYASRQFAGDLEIEILLRPRMPLVQIETSLGEDGLGDDEEKDYSGEDDVDEEMEENNAIEDIPGDTLIDDNSHHPGLGPIAPAPVISTTAFGLQAVPLAPSSIPDTQQTMPISESFLPRALHGDEMVVESQPGAESDDESVHLVMELDSDSD